MTRTVKLAVDAMGGDIGAAVTTAAVAAFVRDNPHVCVDLFATEGVLDGYVDKGLLGDLDGKITAIACGPQVENNEKPSSAVRGKRSSSMARAIEAVSSGQADACVSAGNTGALMALGMVLLKNLTGISRPAICGVIPTLKNSALVLDLGANIDCSSIQLHQFAHLGSLTSQRIFNLKSPRVRLLNVGLETNKGPQFIQEAGELLSADDRLNYCGYLEADQLFSGDTDVIVCDGMSGNIALKASEGTAAMINAIYLAELQRNWVTRLSAALFIRSTASLNQRLNPSRYNGAYLLGLRGVVVKSHGAADTRAFYQALNIAARAESNNLPKDLESIMPL
ncbi:MAG: phosphate acyltransferase PlsX [Porticoccaceae bacterium]|nr:phosphate acyltransferase PlsX [Porticoccaceae bacterium]